VTTLDQLDGVLDAVRYGYLVGAEGHVDDKERVRGGAGYRTRVMDHIGES